MSPGHPYFQGLRAGALEEMAAGKLQVPHLVVWGRNDPMADYDTGLKFFDIAAASAARTELRVINHAGHSPMVEYPEIFNEAVIGFCGDYRSQLD
jgi:pimeloyl-ACP methyl ester carboxylesterase